LIESIGKLDSPPVGEFDEHEPTFHFVDARIVLFLVVIDPEIKNSAWAEFIAKKQAGVNVIVIVVVIRDKTQG
jgi:hypothetical protein